MLYIPFKPVSTVQLLFLTMYKNNVKPALDRIIACLLLIVLSPLLFAGFIAAAIDSRGNPIFRHTRPGLNEKPIQLLKFQTMKDEFDANGRQLSNIERITRIGRILRNTSIDELPQLFNVLEGSLSLVGPRPLQMWYLPHYTDEQRKRHSVRPGITGLAQVSGRNTLSWVEKFELDVQYVNTMSFWLDLKILAKTCSKVFSAGDINSSSGNTMDAFVKKDNEHEHSNS